MKFKTTNKEIKNGYYKIIKISYCSLWYLLKGKDPIAYTSGIYGWNADLYEISRGVAICTGYRPVGNVEPDYELVREYNEKAKELWQTKFDGHFKEFLPIIDELLNEFIEKVLGE